MGEECVQQNKACDSCHSPTNSAECVVLEMDGSVVKTKCQGEPKWCGLLHSHGRDLVISEEEAKQFEHEHVNENGVYRHTHVHYDRHTHPGDLKKGGFKGRPLASYEHEHVSTTGELYRHSHPNTAPHSHNEGELWRGWTHEDFWTAYRRQHSSLKNLGVDGILFEVYNPRIILKKLWPVFVLRCAKFLALGINQGVGKVFCGWDGKENRILDWTGVGAKRLFADLYGGTKITEAAVLVFLQRRLIYCAFTTFATILQILISIYFRSGAGISSLIISFVQAPITILDRQWCALVTKLSPREERTGIIHFRDDLAKLITDHYPLELERRQSLQPKLMAPMVAVEMFSGFIQFCTAVVLLSVNASFVTAALFRTNTLAYVIEQHIGNAWLVVIFVRLIKELTNWSSSLLEYYTTPWKYSTNQRLFRTLLQALVKHDQSCCKLMERENLCPEIEKIASALLNDHIFTEKPPPCVEEPSVGKDGSVTPLEPVSCEITAGSEGPKEAGEFEFENKGEGDEEELRLLGMQPERDPLLELPEYLQYDNLTPEERHFLLSFLELVKKKHRADQDTADHDTGM